MILCWEWRTETVQDPVPGVKERTLVATPETP